jgi:hypothetical protein
MLDFKKRIKKNLKNIPGWRTDRKIVVIESDDWGALRMPSKKAYNKLIKKGIRVDKSAYDSKDCLANKEDIELLCDVLLKNQKEDSKPVFTFNTVMANPDFEKIKESKFEKYYFKHFFDSYKRYVGEDLEPTWFAAMEEGFIKPQFHAREHLNTSLWMQALRNNYKEIRIAFSHEFYGLRTGTPAKYQKHYGAAYHPINEKDFEDKVDITREGLNIFTETFGFQAISFIACQCVWPAELEKKLEEMGIKIIQGRGQSNPNIYTGEKDVKRHYMGQKNKYKQIYFVRNCLFEPAENPEKDWVKACLEDIKTAFRWKKPAIISSHRVSYVSGLDKKNRDKNLKLLDCLLTSITKYWPEVEFMSTDKLGEMVLNDS